MGYVALLLSAVVILAGDQAKATDLSLRRTLASTWSPHSAVSAPKITCTPLCSQDACHYDCSWSTGTRPPMGAVPPFSPHAAPPHIQAQHHPGVPPYPPPHQLHRRAPLWKPRRPKSKKRPTLAKLKGKPAGPPVAKTLKHGRGMQQPTQRPPFIGMPLPKPNPYPTASFTGHRVAATRRPRPDSPRPRPPGPNKPSVPPQGYRMKRTAGGGFGTQPPPPTMHRPAAYSLKVGWPGETITI